MWRRRTLLMCDVIDPSKAAALKCSLPQYPGEDVLAHTGQQWLEQAKPRLADAGLLAVAEGEGPPDVQCISSTSTLACSHPPHPNFFPRSIPHRLHRLFIAFCSRSGSLHLFLQHTRGVTTGGLVYDAPLSTELYRGRASATCRSYATLRASLTRGRGPVSARDCPRAHACAPTCPSLGSPTRGRPVGAP